MEEHNIKLPEPIKSKKIYNKLDLFSENSQIRRWTGVEIIDTLFYLYLFNKYKNNCLIVGSTSFNLGLKLIVKPKISYNEIQKQKQYINEVAEQLADCINRGLDTIIIPLYLVTPVGGHANVLIYRKQDNVIEHFEPHGSYFLHDKKFYDLLIDKLNNFIKILNNKITKPATLIESNKICPYIDGLQSLESRSSKNLEIEGKGYCAAWSMFFAELAMKNPTIPSKDLIEIIFEKLKNIKNSGDYLRKVIRGYVYLIHEKLNKYFSLLLGENLSIDELHLKEKSIISLVFEDIDILIDIENELLNNQSLTKQKYLDNLVNQYNNNTTSDENKKEIKSKMKILKKIDLLLNPSPVSESISSIREKLCPKGQEVSSKTGKCVNICPEGKERNPQTGRCINKNKKTIKRKTSIMETPIFKTTPVIETPVIETPVIVREKLCPDGQEVNSKTGKCVNICPEGKERNPQTGRCINKNKKTIKRKTSNILENPKNKCPEGKERNPKTGRCINIKKTKTVKRK